MRIRAEADAARAKLANLEPSIASPVRSPSMENADSDGSSSPQDTPESQLAEAKRTAEAAPATSQTDSQKESESEEQRTLFHGLWLRQKRQEAGLRTNDVVRDFLTTRQDLFVLERNDLRLPLAWIPALRKMNFLTADEATTAKNQAAASNPKLKGNWLRKQRVRRKMKRAFVAAKLRMSSRDLQHFELRNWPVPTAWLPIIQELFPLPKTMARKDVAANKRAETPPKPAQGRATTEAPKPIATKPDPQPIPKAAAPQQQRQSSRELTETIVNYRLMLDERAGLSAVEVLAKIATDLQLALGPNALSYTRLRAALKVVTAKQGEARRGR